MKKQFMVLFVFTVLCGCVLAAGCVTPENVTSKLSDTINKTVNDIVNVNDIVKEVENGLIQNVGNFESTVFSSSSYSELNGTEKSSGVFEITQNGKTFSGTHSSDDPIVGTWTDAVNPKIIGKINGDGTFVLTGLVSEGMPTDEFTYNWGKLDGETDTYIIPERKSGEVYLFKFNKTENSLSNDEIGERYIKIEE